MNDEKPGTATDRKSGPASAGAILRRAHPNGLVQIPNILSSPSDELSAAELLATISWRFAPAVVNGKPVTTHVQLPIVFTPDQSR